MSEASKAARAAMKAKAARLAKGTAGKVDASSWTQAEPLNTTAKTGMRPVSRRQFKKGGMVLGDSCVTRADRAPRKAGGVTKEVAAKVNRDVKAANAKLGKPHVGGMKNGGDASVPSSRMQFTNTSALPYGKAHGGPAAVRKAFEENGGMEGLRKGPPANPADAYHLKHGTMEGYVPRGPNIDEIDRISKIAKASGGSIPMEQAIAEVYAKIKARAAGKKKRAAALPVVMSKDENKIFDDNRESIMEKEYAAAKQRKADRALKVAVSPAPADEPSVYSPGPRRGFSTFKKGGKANYDGGTRPTGGRRAKADGGEADKKQTGLYAPAYNKEAVDAAIDASNRSGRKVGKAEALAIHALLKGRTGRKSGGRAKKAKTNINININTGKPTDQMPLGAGPVRPPVMPMPPPGNAPPMPMPPPGGAPPMPMPPPGGVPARERGGRVGHRSYKSYKDMDAGGLSGMGRIEKTAIAKNNR